MVSRKSEGTGASGESVEPEALNKKALDIVQRVRCYCILGLLVGWLVWFVLYFWFFSLLVEYSVPIKKASYIVQRIREFDSFGRLIDRFLAFFVCWLVDQSINIKTLDLVQRICFCALYLGRCNQSCQSYQAAIIMSLRCVTSLLARTLTRRRAWKPRSRSEDNLSFKLRLVFFRLASLSSRPPAMRICASAILGGALSGELSLIVDGGRHLANQSSSAIITFRENVKQMLRESLLKPRWLLPFLVNYLLKSSIQAMFIHDARREKVDVVHQKWIQSTGHNLLIFIRLPSLTLSWFVLIIYCYEICQYTKKRLTRYLSMLLILSFFKESSATTLLFFYFDRWREGSSTLVRSL